jgi:SNF2 family DNA or RNA helicase
MSIAVAEEMLGIGQAKLCVIVCPSALKYQWAQSLAQFTDLPKKKHKLKQQTVVIPASPDCIVIDGKPFQRNTHQYSAADDRKRQWAEVGEATEYVIVSYEDVLADYRYLRRIEPDLVIADEITAIKSFKAQRSKKLKKYLDSPYRIGLTGTPLENGRPEELFSIMQWVDDTILGRWDLFDATYIVRDDRGIVLGYQNIDLLLEKMAPVMHRLTKEQPEVAKHMPDAVIDEWHVDLGEDARAVYEQMGMDLYDRIKQQAKNGGGFDVAAYYAGHSDEKSAVGKIMCVHTAMEQLLDHPDLIIMSGMDYEETRGLPEAKQKGSRYCYDLWQSGALDEIIGSPKLGHLIEQLNELTNSGSKVLVYTKYRGMLEILAEEIGQESVQFHGAMNPHDKASALAQFKAKSGPKVFLSSHAGSHGVDLPVADHLINYDPAWSSGKADQINARHVRASSTFKTVYIHNLVTSGTVEARMLDVQSGKRETSRAFLGDKKGVKEMERQTQSLTNFLEQTIEGLSLLT